jgi:hypothetical protein
MCSRACVCVCELYLKYSVTLQMKVGGRSRYAQQPRKFGTDMLHPSARMCYFTFKIDSEADIYITFETQNQTSTLCSSSRACVCVDELYLNTEWFSRWRWGVEADIHYGICHVWLWSVWVHVCKCMQFLCVKPTMKSCINTQVCASVTYDCGVCEYMRAFRVCV